MQLKMCRKCGKATPNPSGICDACANKQANAKRQDTRKYDAEQRDKKADAFYHSGVWKRMRLTKLTSVDYQCELCKAEAERGEREVEDIQLATEVHHVVPIRVNWALRLVFSNLLALCPYHHRMQHSKKPIPGDGRNSTVKMR